MDYILLPMAFLVLAGVVYYVATSLSDARVEDKIERERHNRRVEYLLEEQGKELARIKHLLEFLVEEKKSTS